MKKIALLPVLAFALFLALLGCTSPQQGGVSGLINETEQGQGAIAAGTPFYSTGLLSDWRILSILLVLITLGVVALARMLADPLNLPELKAWANVEWAQTFVTVAIVAFAVVTIQFIDIVVMQEVNLSPGSPVTCTASDFCLVKISNTYLDGLINLSNTGAQDSFVKAINAGKAVQQRTTFTCGTLLIPPCFFGYISWANNAFLMLDIERYNQEIEQYGSIIYSLAVQKFFVDNVLYYVGPALLLIGIVARSFFLTRRIGGLMMASAFGIMFVFPMMYLWNMITLNVTIFGDKLFAGPGDECPAACGVVASIAAKDQGSTPATAEDLENLTDEEYEMLSNGTSDAGGLISCEKIALDYNKSMAQYNTPQSSYYCARACRQLPYPYTIPQCADPKVELACMQMPVGCKAIKNMTTPPECSVCPSDCRIVPPLQGGTACGNGACIDASNPKKPIALPFNCRVAALQYAVDKNGNPIPLDPNDPKFRPDICKLDNASNLNTWKNLLNTCTASLSAESSCSYVVPDIPDCECVEYNETSNRTRYGGGFSECCINAPDVPLCRLYTKEEDDGEGGYVSVTHADCEGASEPEKCLNYTGARYWNHEGNSCTCKGANCTQPSTKCEACILNVTNDYCIYSNQVPGGNQTIVPDCPDECAASSLQKPALLTPAEFAMRSGSGMFGREDVKSVSKLMLAAYLLPLINIAVTLMFIRSFSPLLGGDIEIPGYLKVL